MAFWGIEVKPGKPVTHFCEKARGRLRVTQATLGISDATSKSIVQCNVGERSPVLLCVLLPNHIESCHLDLEFEEADDVIFSVLGPRSIYLTGYYVRKSQQSSPQSDSESYGVDIQDTQTEESSCRSDDDEYEDSFIDDDELQDFSPPPELNSKVIDETASEDEKLNNGNGNGNGLGRRLRKKYQVVESDMDVSSHESEGEDGYLLSVFKNKKAAKTTSSGVEASHVNQELPAGNGKDKLHSLDIGNRKRKRKEHPKEEKTCEVRIDKGFDGVKEHKQHEAKASKNLETGDHDLEPPPESSPENCKKSKKRRKEKLEGTSTEGIDEKFEDDKSEQDLLHADSQKKNLPDGNQEQQIDNNVSIRFELPANTNQSEKKSKKKTKKKKNQGEGVLDKGLPDMTDNQETKLTGIEIKPTNEKPVQKRTLSNGLIIEEVANGPPEGKAATHGKKVKIFYTAMLKENGHVFDSNVGKRACKFWLGDEEIITGWNLGIEGMRVGDKRKLVIPPSMGFGKQGGGENVPPNSWLIYEVELVGVSHK